MIWKQQNYLIIAFLINRETITYIFWFQNHHPQQQQQQQKIEEKYMEEMLLPRLPKMKFGEEYSSDTTLLYMYCYSITMQRKCYKMISNKLNVISWDACIMFEKYVLILVFFVEDMLYYIWKIGSNTCIVCWRHTLSYTHI